jgi:hypothetical protein
MSGYRMYPLLARSLAVSADIDPHTTALERCFAAINPSG